MPAGVATVERKGAAAVVRLRGDVTIPAAGALYGQLRALAKKREIGEVVVDFSGAGRVDSAGIAAISLARRQIERAGKRIELTELNERHRAAFELLARSAAEPAEPPPEQAHGLELLGERVIGAAGGGRALLGLVGATLRQIGLVVTGRARLPAGALTRQIAAMGADGVFIVALLSCLLGMTIAFQAAVQLQRFGAGVFVADMLGISMVRELAPLMTAVIVTGRTGAAIAAELGTMTARSEIDALTAMGISPVRFLVVPRLIAITFTGPALTLMGAVIGLLGGMLVARFTLGMAVSSFWGRLVESLELADWAHGMAKSFVFAWIIGLAGAHLGLSAGRDARSVGTATTRTVVVSIFWIIVVDAIFATASTLMRDA